MRIVTTVLHDVRIHAEARQVVIHADTGRDPLGPGRGTTVTIIGFVPQNPRS